uniref:Uncharacterized protein n=1 Tax=Klebsiella pneumoniae TaxID=573 RepID=A0A2P1BN61_KLEPN|nr:hypothetical protein [Klebsiella pneumoniae]
MGQDAFRRPRSDGNQQVIAVAVRHRCIQQLPRPDLCLNGRVDVRHRNLPAPVSSAVASSWGREKVSFSLSSSGMAVNGLFCRVRSPAFCCAMAASVSPDRVFSCSETTLKEVCRDSFSVVRAASCAEYSRR